MIGRELAREILANGARLAHGDSGNGGSGGSGGSGGRAVEPSVAQTVASGERVLGQLQERLVRWFGPDGVDAILIRALDVARAEHPIMARVHHDAPGVLRLSGILDGVTNNRANSSNGEAANGEAAEATEAILALVATILQLIARLVGDDMTQHLVGQIWSQAQSGEMLSGGDSHNDKVGK
jgi:hypothetical protein